MKKLFIFLSIILLLNGCFKAPIKTGAVSEENRVNLSSLAIGMSPDQVLEVMGYPYSTQEKLYDNKVYEIWYYITEPTLLGQSKLITRNFTPLVFETGHLKGWGNNFYKYTFDIEGEKSKAAEDKRQQYTDDKHEWPTSEHRTIEPMNGKSTKKAPSDQKTEDTQKTQCFPQSSSETPQNSSTSTQTPSATSRPQIDQTSKSTAKPTDEKTIQPQDTSKDAIDTSKDSKTLPASQTKPGCCKPKTTKTNACQKYKEPPKSQKEEKAQKPTDEKKTQEKSPCEMRKDTDETQGYNFWE